MSALHNWATQRVVVVAMVAVVGGGSIGARLLAPIISLYSEICNNVVPSANAILRFVQCHRKKDLFTL